MTSRRADIIAALLLAPSVAAILAGLGRLPALTVDESWVGMFALSLRERGLFTPHEMNTYTGPVYALLVSRLFAWRIPSLASLRLLGACANVAAALVLAANLRRRAGAQAAAWFGALLAGSSYFLLKSRMAWDVYALQPLLLALIVSTLDEPVTAARSLFFCAAILLGVQNHFIFLSVPLSLAVLYGARAAWAGDDGCRPWFRLSTSALAMGAVVFLVKPRLSEASWASERGWALPLFFALAPAAAAAAAWGGDWERRIVDLLRVPGVRRWSARGLKLGLLAFAVWHAAPLWQLLADPLIWRRTFSWIAPWSVRVPLGVWSAFLLGLVAWRAARAWHDRGVLTAHERTLALWPAAYAAIFILFRNTTSLRYYSCVQFLVLASLACALPRLPRPGRRAAAALAAFAVLAAQGVFWRELRAPGDRPPLRFKIGTHTESSRDFTRKEGLFAAFDASGACGIGHQDRTFIAYPLEFHRALTGPVPCDPTKAFDADFCPDCAAPPYYRWSVVTP
ncbi:MAG: hypothetical protein KGJ84_06120 [Elusimicrobia bacterium]|nr:hypothetical protein [Elusimicrobiota bacterium]